MESCPFCGGNKIYAVMPQQTSRPQYSCLGCGATSFCWDTRVKDHCITELERQLAAAKETIKHCEWVIHDQEERLSKLSSLVEETKKQVVVLKELNENNVANLGLQYEDLRNATLAKVKTFEVSDVVEKSISENANIRKKLSAATKETRKTKRKKADGKICSCCYRCRKHCLCGQDCFDYGKASFKDSTYYGKKIECDDCVKK